MTVVGDSLAVLGGKEIAHELSDAGWRVRLVAYPGVTTGDQIDEIRRAAADLSHTVVIELGTNDAHAVLSGDLDVATARQHVHEALDLFEGRCVVWVNADADPSRPGGSAGGAFDAILADEASQRPNLHVVDLSGLLAQHPEYFISDQVHLTSEGSTALGKLMADGAAQCR